MKKGSNDINPIRMFGTLSISIPNRTDSFYPSKGGRSSNIPLNSRIVDRELY